MPFQRAERTTADANGNASIQIYWTGNVDAVVTNANISTDPVPPNTTNTLIPTGVAFVNGRQVDTADMAANAASTTRVVIPVTQAYTFVWTGCDAGAVCKLSLFGVLYTAGTAPPE